MSFRFCLNIGYRVESDVVVQHNVANRLATRSRPILFGQFNSSLTKPPNRAAIVVEPFQEPPCTGRFPCFASAACPFPTVGSKQHRSEAMQRVMNGIAAA